MPQDIKFELFAVGDRRALIVMAAEAEFGDSLKQLISPEIIGVGPVEASVNTTIALSKLSNAAQMPDLVISMGSAGSRALPQGDIFQVSQVSYRDMDASALGFEPGTTPFLDLPAKVELPLYIDDLPEATLSTGANIISGKDYDAIDTDLVDMETFAVLRACQKFDVPLLGLRGVSDGKSELKQYSDWADYLAALDQKFAELLKGLSKRLRWRQTDT